ncbi:MAG: tetratricopeptide repeat protein [Pseudomonadota bacterium]
MRWAGKSELRRRGRGRISVAIGVTAITTATLFAAAPAVVGSKAFAMGEAPQPAVDCRKRKNRGKPECRKAKPDASQAAATTASAPMLSDDQIYAAAYVLANSGNYREAKALLLTAADQAAPRILNYLGFTTRKLGDAAGALPFYERALKAQPDYAIARSYYGEALVKLGRVSEARVQLTKIAQICGQTCEAYTRLAAALKTAS